MLNCDSEKGLCSLNVASSINDIKIQEDELAIVYVGDPMCSWCWGLSPILKQVQEFCTENKIKFNIMLGGLRLGGGDLWNDEFKSFLKNEWLHINSVTGQKFVLDLFEKDYFNYDTEPACKAIFVVKNLLNLKNDNNKTALEFFSSVQKKFYTKGEDSTQIVFYKSICEEFDISFDEFSFYFNLDKTKDELYREIHSLKQLMVRGMPTLILLKNGTKFDISTGYKSYESIMENIKKHI